MWRIGVSEGRVSVLMKIRIRFTKTGSMQYIGHLDLMRYFQKLFRRCGFDVSYSQGFNPHQIMSFASPLGLGVTTIADYLDVSLESYTVTSLAGDGCFGALLSTDEWIERINTFSNGLITVTGIYGQSDNAKPSMSLLSAASYVIYGMEQDLAKSVVDFYNNESEIIYEKQTKKSVKEIDLKKNIYAAAVGYKCYSELADRYVVRGKEYEEKMAYDEDALYVLCRAGSDINIKPEMLLETYYMRKEPDREYDRYAYDIVRTDMFYGDEKPVSMSLSL